MFINLPSVRSKARHLLAATVSTGLAITGLIVTSTPAVAGVDYTNVSTNSAGSTITFKIANLRSASPIYTYVGDSITVSYRYKAGSAGRTRVSHIKCTAGSWNKTAISSSGTDVTAIMTLTAQASPTTCQGWTAPADDSTNIQNTKQASITVHPQPVAPKITTALPNKATVTAGTAQTGSFTYTHTSPPPCQAPTIQWSISPTYSNNNFTASGSTYRFTPVTAATYTITAKIINGCNNPGNLTTSTTIAANPAAPATLDFTPSTLTPSRNTTVNLSNITIKDIFNNTITNATPTFKSNNSTDIASTNQIIIGNASGQRAITGTVGTVSKAKILTVNATPTITSINLGTITAGTTINAPLAIDAYPTKITYNCADLPPQLAITNNTVTGRATMAGAYTATCNATNTTGTGPNFTIKATITPGPVKTLTTTPDQTRIKPDTTVALNLKATDAYNNQVPSTDYQTLTITSDRASDIINTLNHTVTVHDLGPHKITTTIIGTVNPTILAHTTTINVTSPEERVPPKLTGPTQAITTAVGQSTIIGITVDDPTAPVVLRTGTLPAGLAIKQINDKEWQITGTPTKTGTYNCTLQATNSDGTAQLAITITVNPRTPTANPTTKTNTNPQTKTPTQGNASQQPWNGSSTITATQAASLIRTPLTLAWGGGVQNTATGLNGRFGGVGTILGAPNQLIPPGYHARYQWYRSTTNTWKTIPQATTSHYKTTVNDIGHKLKLIITLTKPNAKTITLTLTRTIPKLKPTLKITPTVQGTNLTLKIKLKAKGISKPTGKITVKLGHKKITLKLKPKDRGKVKATITNTPRGQTKLTIIYRGTTSLKKITKRGTLTRS